MTDTILEKDDVSLVNEQIGTHVHEACLAGDVTPSMNAGADALAHALADTLAGLTPTPPAEDPEPEPESTYFDTVDDDG